MTRTALMLAFYFPPFAQSSGSIRTLSFVRHLPDHQWQPVVLTAREHAYPEIDQGSLTAIPSQTTVIRSRGLDVARHLALAGCYPKWLATPDRWNTWALGAFVAGLNWIRRHEPTVLWATFPIASALVAAMALHKVTKIPLVVDLRDPLVYEGWPEDPWMRTIYGSIEKRMLATASAIVVTTPGARRLYIERYPHVPPSRFTIIANGVEDAMNVAPPRIETAHDQPINLLHSGLMELPDRDPTSFFKAIARMQDQGELAEKTLRVILRATGHDDQYRRQVAALKIDRIVSIEQRIAHAEAIEEMRRADGLLLFQGAQCNRQIPAKAYEYLACRRPIIGLLDAAGDTYQLVADQWQVPYVADMSSPSAIVDILRKFISAFHSRDLFVPAAALVQRHARSWGAGELAALFNQVTDVTQDA